MTILRVAPSCYASSDFCIDLGTAPLGIKPAPALAFGTLIADRHLEPRSSLSEKGDDISREPLPHH